MLPGTRFYYDRNGRYRGKASDYGPFTHSIWSMVGIAFLGYLVWEAISGIWVWLLLFTCLAGLGASLLRLMIGRNDGDPRRSLWPIPLFIVSFAGLVSCILIWNSQETQTNSQRDQPAAVSDDNWHPTRANPEADQNEPPTDRANGERGSRAEQVAPPSQPPASAPATQIAPAAPVEERATSRSRLPSFNCRTAYQPVPQLICADRELSTADAELYDLYRLSLSRTGDADRLRQEQRNWMYYSRNACRTRDCIVRAYENRKAELSEADGR